MKRAFILMGLLVLAVLSSTTISGQADGSEDINGSYFPLVSQLDIQSPANLTTYRSGLIELNVSLSNLPGTELSYHEILFYYYIDETYYGTIPSETSYHNSLVADHEGFITLYIPNGLHSISVYARMDWDAYPSPFRFSKVNFTVDDSANPYTSLPQPPPPTPSTTPILTSTPSPIPTETPPTPSSTPTPTPTSSIAPSSTQNLTPTLKPSSSTQPTPTPAPATTEMASSPTPTPLTSGLASPSTTASEQSTGSPIPQPPTLQSEIIYSLLIVLVVGIVVAVVFVFRRKQQKH